MTDHKCNSSYHHCTRGVSSTVRMCTEKATGHEYAVKIIDLTGESDSVDQIDADRATTKQEINQLIMCAGHQNISEQHFLTLCSCYFCSTFCHPKMVKTHVYPFVQIIPAKTGLLIKISPA